MVPTEGFLDEPRKVIADKVMPRAWYEYNGSPQFTFYLVNGSQHVLRSGHKATSLKKGQAALVGLNEGQQISSNSYRNARRSTVDAGGFSIVAAKSAAARRHRHVGARRGEADRPRQESAPGPSTSSSTRC